MFLYLPIDVFLFRFPEGVGTKDGKAPCHMALSFSISQIGSATRDFKNNSDQCPMPTNKGGAGIGRKPGCLATLLDKAFFLIYQATVSSLR
jgi:hypothetical protein